MMNSHSYLLLLIIITINITLSISVRIPLASPALRQQIGKEIGGQTGQHVFQNVIQNVIDQIFNQGDRRSPPSPQVNEIRSPSPQVKEIQGLSLIKQYLYDFGYLQQSGTFDNFLDKDTISAIELYQQNFNLQATGDLNNQTLQQILLPRCGVPDINFEYNLTDTINASWPKGNKWFPEGTKNLTYGFAPESKIPLNATKVFRNALARWSTTTKVLNFTETSYNDANIKIGFYNYVDDGVKDIVVGDTIISLQLNSSVNSGVIRLDASKYWILPTDNYTGSWQDGEFDLETVVMHQIGHLLGLDHSFEKDSIMYPTILPSQQRKVQIAVSDNQNIHQLYTMLNILSLLLLLY
ncbi:metalloendoproteinase 1-like [Trifolium medium]|uniref:Metalloendoproteinase 1-like n=1 Tax=Trifolium medium TaxID=97028 RepID=A0A392M3H8_9FABA|nr:metalloendoproteinase 1-like [Trifolium medium]